MNGKMNGLLRSVACFALGMVGPLQALAHHSPAQYEEDVIVERDATVVRFDFRNPHTYILVRDKEGAEWMLETSSAVRLQRNNWNRDLFTPGDEVSFSAQANRNPQKNRLYLNAITAPNGETFTVGRGAGGDSEAPPAAVASSLGGVWTVDTENFPELFGNFRRHPLTDKARQAQQSYDETTDPVADCVAYPTPHIVFVSFIYPMRIELGSTAVTFQHEFFNTTRTVYMDGRGHPDDTPLTNQGHSVGHWDGDTLVVDTRFFAEHRNPMLADFPSSTRKHVVERYTLSEDGTYATADIFIDDPEYIPEPLEYQLILRPAPHEELQDFECDPEIARRFTE